MKKHYQSPYVEFIRLDSSTLLAGSGSQTEEDKKDDKKDEGGGSSTTTTTPSVSIDGNTESGFSWGGSTEGGTGTFSPW